MEAPTARRSRYAVLGLLVGLVALAVATAGPVAAVNRDKVRRPGPLRVLLVGDSLTVDYQDEAAAALTAKGYQVFREGIKSTGLLDANKCKGQFASVWKPKYDPDVVVYEQVGNYLGYPPCSPVVLWGSKAWIKAWARSAKVSQRILAKKGTRFFWMTAPQSRSQENATYDAVIPQVRAWEFTSRKPVIDAWAAFGGPTYVPSVHQPDGLHLNQIGQQKMADLVVKRIG